MKRLNKRNFNRSGFSVAEMAVACAVLGLLGAVFFQVLNSGMILYAKNTAVNAAHEEARGGIVRLTRDIHASISVPQLRDVTFNVVSSTPVGGVPPTSAGVSFQNIASGPNYVWKDPGDASLIMIKDGGSKPKAGMRLIIPFWGLEEDVTKVTASGTSGHSNVFILADQSTPQITAPVFGGSYAITYYTYRTMYVVRNGSYVPDANGPWVFTTGTYTSGAMERYVLQNGSYVPSSTGTYTITPAAYTSGTAQRYRYENGELHFYRQDYSGSSVYWKDAATVARYISSPQPFYIPLNSGGSPDTKYVGVKLTARDPTSSNRGFLATASLLDTQIDFRSRIALYQ